MYNDQYPDTFLLLIKIHFILSFCIVQTKFVDPNGLPYIRDNVPGGYRELHGEELHSSYSSADVIRMVK
jgi:hypothetical protein